ncbi:DUF6891 domain-containing protein [Nocardioides gilvus]|uniref:DUF6891 domain-containing protein n=1 Tax=Nocardioides gilvus TaxID=1735589 RepID=UPI000D7489C2|nr:hypothetical protein [Nocardioides gilvus]
MARASVEDDLRDFARLQVRAGLNDPDQQLAEVIEATRVEMPHTDAAILARAWLAAARQEVAALAASWDPVTDFERLQAAFAECDEHALPVLQGVRGDAEARAGLTAGQAPLRGLIWFVPADVWHAIDHGVLEIHLWRPDGSDVAPGDHLATLVTGCFQRHGLAARQIGDRIQVSVRWERRP